MATDKPNTEDSAKSNQQPELNAVLDKGGEVREGEELDAQAISSWLRDQGVDIQGEPLQFA